MQTTVVDSSTNWKSLPWKQIQEKIFIIQQKLYNCSKECNYKDIHKLQNYLLNSSDSKIFAIQKVIRQIKKYYFECDKENYIFYDKDKFLIYESLFKNKSLSKECFFIREQIKQYLVYICLKPEWEGRFEPGYKFNLNEHKQYYFLYRFSKFLLTNKKQQLNNTQNHYFRPKISNKCIDINYLINKIQPVTSILYYLQNWLSNKYIKESVNTKIYLDNTIGNLHKLIHHIIYNGSEWSNIILDYSYTRDIYYLNFLYKWHYLHITSLISYATGIQHNITSIYKLSYLNTKYSFTNHLINYTNRKLRISIDLTIYKYLKRQIRQILYHQNQLYKWRPNHHLPLKNLMNKINNELRNFYIFYYPLINKRNLVSLIVTLENIIFRWIKKNKCYLKSLIVYKKTKYLYLNQHKKYVDNYI